MAFLLSPAAYTAPFQYEMLGDPTLPSDTHTEWHDMHLRWEAESARYRRCYSAQRDCPDELQGLKAILRHARKASRFGQLRLINRFVNRRPWVADELLLRGAATDRWQTVGEFFRNGGDCEDFAIAKYLLLRELGFPAKDLRVVATIDGDSGLGHALLAARIDGAIMLIDSDDTVYRSYERHDYEFVYSINELGIWEHRETATRPVTTAENRREQ